MSKLTQDDRATIVRRSHAGETQQSLADEYGVAQSTIARILENFRRQGNTLIEDPNPSLADEHVQARFWKKHQRYCKVLHTRNSILLKNIENIQADIRKFELHAKEAPTRELSKVYQRRADTFRDEIEAIKNLSDIEDELTELLSDLYTLSQVLCRGRKVGLGTTTATNSRGEWL